MRKAMEGRGLRAGLGPKTLLAVLAVLLMASAVAARADAYVYWANDQTGAIGRANLDGTGVNQSFIGGVGPGGAFGPNDVEVDSEYVYWVNYGHKCHRAREPQRHRPSTPASSPRHRLLWFRWLVDSSHIYWVNQSPSSAGRSEGPTSTAQVSIRTSSTTADNGPRPFGYRRRLHLLGEAQSADSIGRANLDGTGVNQSFITGIDRVNSRRG